MAAAGETRPEWCFLLERAGRPVGRVGFRVEATCPAGVPRRPAGPGVPTSDADVRNAPMAAAFEATGHRADARPWHVWHYRAAATS